ncbi:hypothetical protein IFT47_16130 [Pseudomonas sp. CFBP 13711]|jgi:hypothetical protein|uniref:hypothetical protein n=1 Tax=unclassified Pseudomonas TaxID=196821 RepID=UPI00177FE1F9|nr:MULTISPECIES: hypothetical protein [unclassified Pseudomonas]MBD8708163.1 hypothetical protein [Pseudomonas sp. CFBP 13711]MBD8713597.1 hypothetical protein [Pseudomonas sp. CFBP 13715]
MVFLDYSRSFRVLASEAIMRKINKVVFLLVYVVLVACVSEQRSGFDTTQRPIPHVAHRATIQQDSGEDVVRHLTNRYADTAANCGTPSQPAFLCNGVMIRGTSNSPGAYHVWDNSPASITRGGVSASYLRSDANFRKLAWGYNNGYILTAYLFAEGKLHPEVLCLFPVDAGTGSRTDRGCGEHPGTVGSRPCHLQNVTTAAQWWTHYTSQPGNLHYAQCGFDVSDDRNDNAGPAFVAGLEAMSLMGSQAFVENNELVLAVWDSGLGKTLPLEAFFYLAGSAGLPVAQHNQSDLINTDGVWIPVIKITLPTTAAGKVTFSYSADEQTPVRPPVQG